MMSWLCRSPYRLPILLGIYFAAHVIVRWNISTSLDYDESEQVFLSQFLLMGYNSQPPLYTWIQSGMFEVFGYTVLPLALLKNVFLWLTYMLVFETVRKATGDMRLAALASLGLLTIPQIAWESHRDLSHTVAATFATTLLCYCVVSLAKETGSKASANSRRPDRSMLWYVLIGLAVGTGILFKYNFVLVLIGFVVASLSIPQFRPLVLDSRIWISILIAGVITLPHGVWMLGHMDLVSAKTFSTMSENRSDLWIGNVVGGLFSMGLSFLSCCALTFAAVIVLFVRKRAPQTDRSVEYQPSGLLLERFLLTVLVMLTLIVLTGHASEFRNRWFQPFVCLVPAYLALRFGPSILRRPRAMDLSVVMTVGLMVVVLGAVISRPTLSRYRGKYCWLNIPYGRACEVMHERSHLRPDIIVAANMRVAGNLKIQYPDAYVVSYDVQHLTDERAAGDREASKQVLAVADKHSKVTIGELADFAGRVFDRELLGSRDGLAIEVEYQYGAAGDTQCFRYNEFQLAPIPQSTADIAALHRPTANH